MAAIARISSRFDFRRSSRCAAIQFCLFDRSKLRAGRARDSKLHGCVSILAKGLGLSGGSFTLDAACASSIFAVKLACDELLSYRADAMLAGGVSRPDALYTQVGFSQL
ncbi:MAG: hypothetical protein MUE87_05665, partial [Methanothrix sp.]|nr:hypothetical protein [Methanothrix sp.]